MKLDGLRVLDLSAFLPGPHMTMMMADHGADVIMVEPANGIGEPTRHLGYRTEDDVSVWFRNIARGKKSLKINLKDPEAHAFFMKLAETADVIVEAFRPGVVSRLGIDYDTVSVLNKGLIYCSISAFGQTGPYRDKPAHDLAIQGLAGTVHLNRGLEDGKPALPNMPAADMAASLMALSGIMMALYAREKTGQGDYLDISMYDALLAWTPNVSGPVFANNQAPEPKRMRSFGGAAMNNIYETADGEFIILGGSEKKFVSNLLALLERPDLLELATGEPGSEQDELTATFREIFRSKSRADWEAAFAKIDLSWSPVRTLKDAMDDPHMTARQMILTDIQGQRHVGNAIKYQKEPPQPNLTLPGFGEHSVDLAREAGLSAAEVSDLKSRGVI